jgi:hypothetical protein
MRLWTLHPCYLDGRGLGALWRESLLARKVLRGETTGYRKHPQLTRFLSHPQPLNAISSYLQTVYAEGVKRGCRYDPGKLDQAVAATLIPVTRGQLLYEWRHLRNKLEKRAPQLITQFESVREPKPHPLFSIVDGDVEPWEIQKSD